MIVTFASHHEDHAWIDEASSGTWLPAMASLRSDIVNGDWRAFYLGWLAGASASFDAFDATDSDLDDEILPEGALENRDLFEPPVPPGLGQLTPSLRKLAGFLRLDRALIDAAAERSTQDDATESGERRTVGDLARAARERAAQLGRRASERQARDRAGHPDALDGDEDDVS